jgi:hypothetical protein
MVKRPLSRGLYVFLLSLLVTLIASGFTGVYDEEEKK